MKLMPVVGSALLLAVIGLALLPPLPAGAHADYDSSTPGRGEQLAVAPTQVEITFTQEIQKIAGTYGITVNKDRGLEVTSGPAVVNDTDRTKLSVSLQSGLEDGRYVVNWNNVSDADGDPKAGAFSFYLNHIPTAVDLANDAALEQIGNEGETPVSGNTPPASTPVMETPDPSSVAEGATAVPTLDSSSGEGDDDGSSNTAFIAVGGVMVALVIFGGAFAIWRSRAS